MGLKTPKLHSGLLRNIKSFILNFILLNKINYMLLFICLHPYPINIVSDSIYSVFVLKNIKTSTINSNQPIVQQLFFKLQSVVKNHNSPIYITHIQYFLVFQAPWLMIMNKLMNWFPLLLQKNSMFCCITMLAPYTSYRKSHTARLKKLLVIALLVDPYIFDPSHKVLILVVYNLMNYDKWM